MLCSLPPAAIQPIEKCALLLYYAKYFLLSPSGSLQAEVRMNVSLMKQPSAYLPISMSLTALALVLGHAAIYGIVHEADEGATAHLFQILMVAQVPLIGYFTLKWLPQVPGQALRVLALQAAAALAAFAAVYGLT